MSKHRTPSNILELKGAFKKNPQRKRVDCPGVGLFDASPPQHLQQDCVRAWNEIVKRVPIDALTHTDELAVEICATLLANWWLTKDMDVLKELRQWFASIGMTPAARTKIPSPPKRSAGNPFTDL